MWKELGQEILRKTIQRFGYEKTVADPITREHFFDLYFSLRRPFVVQLGANDGKTHDPLHYYIDKYKLPGLLVEPQIEIFEKLRENYKNNKDLIFANVAVGEADGEMSFFRIKPALVQQGKEYKASSGSSFYRDQIIQNIKNRIPPIQSNILKHVSNDPEDYIEEVKIKVLSLASLFSQYQIKEVGLFFTDCQGHDFKILKQLDISRYAPDIINFEHSLLTREELLASEACIHSAGYKYFISEGDTCAYKFS